MRNVIKKLENKEINCIFAKILKNGFNTKNKSITRQFL